jgi:hypothetical protein
VAIHALIVEAIRRDDYGKYKSHKFLGRALNGLLPRRAQLNDLGRGGWNDLAWLLELNQGFYNAAGLAALCGIPDESSVSWLGRPIQPKPGNERLEPLVTALPVSPPLPPPDRGEAAKNANSGCPPLMIIGGGMVGIRPELRRDWAGLYTNKEMRPLRILVGAMLGTGLLVAFILLVNALFFAALGLFIAVGCAHMSAEILVGTMFLERKGWIFLLDSEWGDLKTMQAKLGHQDSHLGKLTSWGKLAFSLQR